VINVCVPVLKRYDRLRDLVVSLNRSDVLPDALYVMDNGVCPDTVRIAIQPAVFPTTVETGPKGVAESWNWFIEHVPEERVITNDDIVFAPQSLAAMVAANAEFVSCTYGFSCFILRDACVQRVGLFDESISPGYAYFEDMDYLRRMRLQGIDDDVVRCGVVHRRSSTPASYTQEELNEHHRRFKIAESNYRAKWASAPSWDQLRAVGGAGANA
jgi:hypothetical protein